jgi:hypothetical protein
MKVTPSRIGFIASQINRIDQVSRESAIWRNVLTEMGHECFYFTGESIQPEERTVIVPEIDWRHPDIGLINHELASLARRSSKTSGMIQALRFHIKQHLYQFIQTFDINILIVENALSLPLNIPLGLALTEVIAETGIVTLARHHDFAWEQPQYVCSPAEDYIHSSFPPKLPSIQHIVATDFHAQDLTLRIGIRAQTIPYVRNFQQPRSRQPLSAEKFIEGLEIASDHILVLSTSPLVPSSRIEMTLALIARMPEPTDLIISSSPALGDHGYLRHLQETADLLDIHMHLVGDRIQPSKGEGEGAIPTLAQCYQRATFVATMGTTQGALAETIDAIYHCCPVLTPIHNITQWELQERGFQLLWLDSYPDREAVELLGQTYNDPTKCEEMVEHNVSLGKHYFSLDILHQKFTELLREDLTPHLA